MAVIEGTVAAPHTDLVEHALADYLKTGYQEIAGWLHMPAVEASLMLSAIQAERVPPGPVAEIGVWEGRYLTLLSFLSPTPQPVLGIDPFIHSSDRTAQLQRVRRNISLFARRPDLVSLLERDSRLVGPNDILERVGGKLNFLSVDGDHTMEGALHDLELAEKVVSPGAIVAVDDIPNMSCPGVMEAVMRYALQPEATLAPFLLVTNKLFMTQKTHCEWYRESLLNRFRAGEGGEWGQSVLGYHNRMKALNVPVRFLGQDLLVRV